MDQEDFKKNHYPIVKIPKAFMALYNQKLLFPEVPNLPKKPVYPNLEKEPSELLELFSYLIYAPLIMGGFLFFGNVLSGNSEDFLLGLVLLCTSGVLLFLTKTNNRNKEINEERISNYKKEMRFFVQKTIPQYTNELKKLIEDIEVIKKMSHVERFELAWGRLEDTLIKKCPKPKPIKIEHLNKKGASEKEFLSVLKKRFEDNLLTAHSIEDDERMYQYVPDFVYYDSLMGVCIDIEIDEPYDGLTKKPIHYVGKDDERDNYFLSKNWIVIRFAEEQVITEPQACVDIIAKVLNKYAGFMDDFNDDRNLNTVKVWTREDAEIMSQKLYRNSYLPFEFNYSQNSHKELSIKQQIEKDNTESSDYDLPF